MSLVVLVEGETETIVLRALLEKLDIPRDRVTIIEHEGVSSLEKSLPRKLRGWTDPSAKFLIMRDNDNGDCLARKAKLEGIIAGAGKKDRTVVRIVCQEIEAWFLGDPKALEAAGFLKKDARPKLLKRDPDCVVKPSKELEGLVRRYSKNRGYQKKSGAMKIANHLNIEQNKSLSFKHAVASIKQLARSYGE
jgi:predicted ATP-dependent endonuclease of OLD family